MRSSEAFVLGAIIGAVAVWRWKKDIEEYVEAMTRGARSRVADRVQAVEETLHAGQDAIRPAPRPRNV
jgi:hypothetical protein